MNTVTKLVAGTLVGVGVIAGYRYFKRLQKAKASLIVVPQASIHSVNLSGMVIRVNVLIKNPTAGSFSIRFPFVVLSYRNIPIGTSRVVDKEIQIPKYGEANIDNILIDVPLESLFSVVTSLIKSVTSKEPVQIKARIQTVINLGWEKLDYEDTQDVQLKS